MRANFIALGVMLCFFLDSFLKKSNVYNLKGPFGRFYAHVLDDHLFLSMSRDHRFRP